MINNKLTVIIPTLAAPEPYITNRLLEELEASSAVKEIMIIDNTQDGMFAKKYILNHKCRIIQDLPNLYVNAAWEFGVSITTTPYYLLLNDDILAKSHVFDKVTQLLEDDSEVNIATVQTMVLYGESDLLGALDNEKAADVTEFSISVYFHGAGTPKTGWFLAGRKEKWIPLPVNGYYSFSISPEMSLPANFEFFPSLLSAEGTFSQGVKRICEYENGQLSVSVVGDGSVDTKRCDYPLLSLGSVSDTFKRSVMYANELLKEKIANGTSAALEEKLNHALVKLNEWEFSNGIHYDAVIRLILEQNKLTGWKIPHFPDISGLDPIMSGDDYILDKNQLLGYKGYAVITSEMLYHAESSTVHARKFIEQMKIWAKPSPVQEDPSNFSDWEEHKKLLTQII